MTAAYRERDLRKAVRLHTLFNDLIYRASGNRRLVDLAMRFHEYTERSQLKSMTLPGRFQKIQEEHYRILGALRQGNPDLADRTVREHVQNAKQAYLRSLETWWLEPQKDSKPRRYHR